MSSMTFGRRRPGILGLLTLFWFISAVLAGCGAPGNAPVGMPPKEKQTSPGLYLTAAEAYAKWKSSPSAVKILDVRTPEEVLYVGHPAMAWNVPVSLQSFEWDSAKKHFAMKPNPDFTGEVRKLAAPGDTLLVMCRSGVRSAKAVNLLAEAGFTNVYNIIDGMEGDAEGDTASPQFGKRVKNGWKNSGLPWTYQPDPAKMAIPGGH